MSLTTTLFHNFRSAFTDAVSLHYGALPLGTFDFQVTKDGKVIVDTSDHPQDRLDHVQRKLNDIVNSICWGDVQCTKQYLDLDHTIFQHVVTSGTVFNGLLDTVKMVPEPTLPQYLCTVAASH